MAAAAILSLSGVLSAGAALAKSKPKSGKPPALAVTAKSSTDSKGEVRAKNKRSKASAKPNWKNMKLDLSRAKVVNGRYVQTLKDGSKVTFTVDPVVQKKLKKAYARYKIPHGGIVLIEPATGKVLAMVSQDKPGGESMPDFAQHAHAPSASVFKIVTAAALLSEKKVGPTESVCYHGGRSSLSKRNIEGSKKHDRRCNDLSGALTWSINSIIAKLTYQRLNRGHLVKWAKKFGYNQTIPFEMKIAQSRATIPKNKHERSRAAAGFWHTYLSPLHGAMIGAAIINDGVMMEPKIVESYQDSTGHTTYTLKPKRWKRVVSKSTARKLKKMLNRTTQVGTARKYFRHRAEFPRKDILTGGKTGTLSRKKPSYLGYTWFVGYGESTHHKDIQVGVGAVVGNKPLWHVKGPLMASEGIRWAIQSAIKRKKTS